MESIKTTNGIPTTRINEPEIKILPPLASQNAALVKHLTDLINLVYRISEEGIWKTGENRTNVTEMIEFINAKEIVIVYFSSGGEDVPPVESLIGCCRFHRLDSQTSDFGMLALSTQYRSLGVGSTLVTYLESHSLPNLQCELLFPSPVEQPWKRRLANWYEKLGFRCIELGDFKVHYPHLEPFLAVPCEYRIYRKVLIAR